MMDLAQAIFTAFTDARADPSNRSLAVAKVSEMIKEKNMAPVAENLISKGYSVNIPTSEIDAMKSTNDSKLKELDAHVEECREKHGESEIREAMAAKAQFLASIGDKDAAVSQYRLTETKTVGVGPKLDVCFAVLELAMFDDEVALIHAQIEKAHKLLEEGGDWERRNKLKVYEAVYFMRLRQFEKAAKLLQESVATFTCTELMTYQRFISYTVVLSLVSCDRPTLKAKVIDSPEIIQVIHELPGAEKLMSSLYQCSYRKFFEALADVSDDIAADRYLHQHYLYYLREMRLKAYTQFLEPYKSVSLASMATSCGLSVEFLDSELGRFISSGRLPCKIDKTAGLVEAQRPDRRNTSYQDIVKKGDSLLNRVQKLSRIINV